MLLVDSGFFAATNLSWDSLWKPLRRTLWYSEDLHVFFYEIDYAIRDESVCCNIAVLHVFRFAEPASLLCNGSVGEHRNFCSSVLDECYLLRMTSTLQTFPMEIMWYVDKLWVKHSFLAAWIIPVVEAHLQKESGSSQVLNPSHIMCL